MMSFLGVFLLETMLKRQPKSIWLAFLRNYTKWHIMSFNAINLH